ncbi:hypothetical protein [Halorussus aquaticus]|uniref:Uncharacterized protein n=1 Tax=Halorussus aquaticus TaxID=2953748 RepID=A0ABD5Q7H4_9EURY|nr:hypothetical protein [Halorussus aquaticus]
MDETTSTDDSTVIGFDCPFCEEELQTPTIEAIRDRGRTHLEIHRTDLLAEFANRERGKACQNDCGYVFPVGVDEVAGFECPECGYDNFEKFAHRYLYWQIEQS